MNYEKFGATYTGTETVIWNVQQWSLVGLDITGSFAAGGIRLRGSNDNVTWTDVPVYNGGLKMTDTLITSAGHYSAIVSGFAMLKIFPGDGASVSLVLGALALAGVGAGSISDPSSETPVFPGLPEGLLWNPGGGAPVQVIDPGGVGQVLQSRGEFLQPAFTNPAALQAFVYGSNLASNPLLANPLARFLRVTDATNIGAGSDFASNPTLIEGSSRYLLTEELPGILEYAPITSGTATRRNGIDWSDPVGLYVEVGEGGLIRTSPTGDEGSWTERTSGTTENLNGVKWVDRLGMFIVGGAAGRVLTSENGVDWAVQIVGVASWGRAADNGTYAVLPGSAGKFLRTPDGVVFTEYAVPNGVPNATSVVWAGSRFVATMQYFSGAGRTYPEIQTSVDGSSWIPLALPSDTSFTYALFSVVVHNGVTVVAGDNGYVATTTSSSGTSGWTLRSSGSAEQLRLVPAKSVLFAVGGNGASVQSFNNGVNWEAAPAIGTTNFVRAGTGSGPLAATKALFVGDSGILIAGQYGFGVSAFPTTSDRSGADPISYTPSSPRVTATDVNDGDYETAWSYNTPSTYMPPNAYLTLDLGSVKSWKTLSIQSSTGTRALNIEVSNDNSAWDAVATDLLVTTSGREWAHAYIGEMSSRYIRISSAGGIPGTTSAFTTIRELRVVNAEFLGSYSATYASLPDEITIPDEVTIDLDPITPADLPLHIDVLRQFVSTAYKSTADRSGDLDPLGAIGNVYSDTPMQVTIPGQVTFNVAVLTPDDVPFDFDVITLEDMAFNLFVSQNSALDPGPFFCFNAIYNFGVANRWEYGPQSDSQYATLMIQDSTTGEWFIKKSDAPGDAGDEITWVDAFQVNADGTLTIPSLAGTGSRAVMADADGKLSAP